SGSFIVAVHFLVARRKVFFTFTEFNTIIRGFNIYIFIIVESIFLIFFIHNLTKIEKKLYPKSILPLTTLIVALFLILLQAEFYWIVKTLIIFPVLFTISLNQHQKNNSIAKS
ncbi:MAG: hypothetical protein ACW97P_11770, partial [Candidatus Hodarchaeales archaeon]